MNCGVKSVSGETYELLAMLMRYVFVFIGILILWRAYRWMRRDAKAYRREMKALPDAGLVGEMVDLHTGESQPLPRVGMIGSSADCDIRLKGAGVARRHVLFAFEEGKGLMIRPCRRHAVMLEDERVKGPAFALHGMQIRLGEAVLRVRLFAGLNVPHGAVFRRDDPTNVPYDPEEVSWADMEDTSLPPFAPVLECPEKDVENMSPAGMGYAGNYTEDGQMTWQFAAYPLEELQRVRQEQAGFYEGRTEEAEEQEEGIPYESPLPRRRRGMRP